MWMELVVQSEQPGEFGNRLTMIIDPQIDITIVVTSDAAIFADDQKRR